MVCVCVYVLEGVQCTRAIRERAHDQTYRCHPFVCLLVAYTRFPRTIHKHKRTEETIEGDLL